MLVYGVSILPLGLFALGYLRWLRQVRHELLAGLIPRRRPALEPAAGGSPSGRSSTSCVISSWRRPAASSRYLAKRSSEPDRVVLSDGAQP